MFGQMLRGFLPFAVIAVAVVLIPTLGLVALSIAAILFGAVSLVFFATGFKRGFKQEWKAGKPRHKGKYSGVHSAHSSPVQAAKRFFVGLSQPGVGHHSSRRRSGGRHNRS